MSKMGKEEKKARRRESYRIKKIAAAKRMAIIDYVNDDCDRNSWYFARLVRLTDRHFIDYIKINNQRRKRVCYVCSARNVKKITSFLCKECNIPLCVGKCFRLYHTKENFTEDDDSGNSSTATTSSTTATATITSEVVLDVENATSTSSSSSMDMEPMTTDAAEGDSAVAVTTVAKNDDKIIGTTVNAWNVGNSRDVYNAWNTAAMYNTWNAINTAWNDSNMVQFEQFELSEPN
jgi:hypothetical protein